MRISPDFSDVLQGIILGPTLFLLYLSDIFNLPNGRLARDIICYVGDTVVVFQDTSLHKVYNATERALGKINDWLNENLLTLNIDKTKFVAFYKARASPIL